MSKRFENGYVALVLTCVFLTFIVGYVSIIFAFSQGYNSADKEHETYYASREAREKAFTKCLERSLTIPVAIRCINNSGNSSREDERAEQDLNAQREMAQWAKGMLWATLIIGMGTIITTAVGVWFVKRTLDSTNIAVVETSKATVAMNEANQIMREEQRAWVAVDFVAGSSVSYSLDSNSIMLELDINPENFGSTPAKNMAVASRLKIIPGEGKKGVASADYSDLIKEVVDEAFAGSQYGQIKDTLFRGRPAKLWLRRRNANASLSEVVPAVMGNASIAICVAICYKIPTGFGSAVCHGTLVEPGKSGLFSDILCRAKTSPVPIKVIWQPTTYT